MRMTTANKPMQGFTLLELLVAMTLGLFMMAGVMSVFISSKQSYVQQDAIGQMQENARFALEVLARDTRMLGAGSCSSEINVANTLDNYVGAASTFSRGLTGYLGNADSSNFPASFKDDSSPNSDAIIIQSVDRALTSIMNDHILATSTVMFPSAGSFAEDDILVMIDANCTSMAIFVNTEAVNTSEVEHLSIANKNCTAALKGNFTCADTSSALALAYSPGSSVHKINSFAYFIGPSSADASILSLYKKDVITLANAEEIVAGVTNLEMFYGVKVNNTMQYFKADGVANDDWINVRSVRYRITVRSLSLVNGTPISRTFTTTVKLRNRG